MRQPTMTLGQNIDRGCKSLPHSCHSVLDRAALFCQGPRGVLDSASIAVAGLNMPMHNMPDSEMPCPTHMLLGEDVRAYTVTMWLRWAPRGQVQMATHLGVGCVKGRPLKTQEGAPAECPRLSDGARR